MTKLLHSTSTLKSTHTKNATRCESLLNRLLVALDSSTKCDNHEFCSRKEVKT